MITDKNKHQTRGDQGIKNRQIDPLIPYLRSVPKWRKLCLEVLGSRDQQKVPPKGGNFDR